MQIPEWYTGSDQTGRVAAGIERAIERMDERTADNTDIDDLHELPRAMVERLEHYFLSYKAVPGSENSVSIPEVYGRDHAFTVVEAAMADYQDAFGQ